MITRTQKQEMFQRAKDTRMIWSIFHDDWKRDKKASDKRMASVYISHLSTYREVFGILGIVEEFNEYLVDDSNDCQPESEQIEIPIDHTFGGMLSFPGEES